MGVGPVRLKNEQGKAGGEVRQAQDRTAGTHGLACHGAAPHQSATVSHRICAKINRQT